MPCNTVPGSYAPTHEERHADLGTAIVQLIGAGGTIHHIFTHVNDVNDQFGRLREELDCRFCSRELEPNNNDNSFDLNSGRARPGWETPAQHVPAAEKPSPSSSSSSTPAPGSAVVSAPETPSGRTRI